MITYRKAILRIGDVYFDENRQADHHPVDVIRLIQTAAPVEGYRCVPFHTIMIDLRLSEDQIYAAMKSDTRREIRRAIDPGAISFELWTDCTSEVVRTFSAFYDNFAASKGLPKANRLKLESLAEASALALSCAYQDEEEPLVWHAYIRTPARVRLLHSASYLRYTADAATRQLIGRANRYLHWKDMLSFKAQGIATLDMGGWHQGTDPEKLRINSFKEEFGGMIVTHYNCETGQTLQGKAALWMGRFWRRLRTHASD